MDYSLAVVKRYHRWRESNRELLRVDVEIAMTHEAGHAVVQWLVGWETIELRMTVHDSNAIHASARCPPPSLDSVSAIRKRLLMLFAGNEATRKRWPNSNNDWGDWQDAMRALREYLHRPIKWSPDDGPLLRDAKANELTQEAVAKCAEVIVDPRVQRATEQIAAVFASSTPDSNGTVQLDGHEINAICDAVIGQKFREANPWSGWIAGE